jgi:hypothetical protein
MKIEETNEIEEEIENEETENEETEKNKLITNPFNTKDIKITPKTTSLDNIIKRLENEEIDLNPDFQRNGGLWDNSKMSRLIESIILRLPLPIFYFDISNNDKWIVIDGLQRLTTIKRFIVDKNLKLTNLEFLKEFQGKKFDDLERNIRRTIEETEIVTYQMEPQTPKEVRYSVFNRINTGGITLNPQEIRQALNQKNNGVKLLEEITKEKDFKNIVNVTSKRMVDRELVLRYIAFKKYNYRKLNQEKKSLPKLLDETMEIVDTIEFENNEYAVMKTSLLKTLSNLIEIFEKKYLFNKKLIDNSKIKVLNKSLFEIWTVLVSDLDNKEILRLKNKKEILKKKYIELLKDQDFNDAVTRGTNDRKSVVKRFSLLEKLIRSVIDD